MSLYADVAFSRNTRLSQAELNRRMKMLADAIETLRLFAPDWQAQVEALRTVGLERINQALLPAYDAILGLAQLGALFSASSSSEINVGTGLRLFAIAEEQRIIFAPAANLAISLDSDSAIVMYGRLAGYDRESGVLGVEIEQATGAGSHSGWTISASPPRSLAHELRVDNPHAVTAAQVGTLTAEEIDKLLDILRTSIDLRLSAETDQVFTEAQRSQLRANADVGVVAGFRNKVINGNFDIWQRGSGPFTAQAGFVADRWYATRPADAVHTLQRIAHVPGQGSVPGNPLYYLRWIRSTIGSGTSRLLQKIENVGTLAGKTVTVTFWARSLLPTELRTLPFQTFGTGGSPSADLAGAAAVHNLTNAWQRFVHVITLPSLAGKTKGSNGDDSLQIRFDWLQAAPNPVNQIDISHVSLVEGDASAESDPFSARHVQQEMSLCQRYYQTSDATVASIFSGSVVSGQPYYVFTPFRGEMRASPTMTLASNVGIGFDAVAGGVVVSPKGFQEGRIATATSGGGRFRSTWTADAEL